MKAEDFSERIHEFQGWPVKLSSYKLGDVYHCSADNLSPGAILARANAPSREEAERKALQRAHELLACTKRGL